MNDAGPSTLAVAGEAGAARAPAGALRRLFEPRRMAAQAIIVGGGTSLIAALAAWLAQGRSDPAWPALVAGGGAFVTAACALLAHRSGRALDRVGLAARALRQDDDAPEAQLPLETGADELRQASARLRALVEHFRRRMFELQALNAELGERLRNRTQQLSTLQDLSIGLARKTELHELVDEALAALEQTIEYSSASVWARQDPGHRGSHVGQVVLMGYRTAETIDAPREDLRGMRLSRPNLQRYEQIEREREPIVENHVRQNLISWLLEKVLDDARTSNLYKNTRSWMALPLAAHERVMGVLRVDHEDPDYFDTERTRLLTAVSSQTALAIHHAELAAQAREVAVLAERNRIARDLHDAVSQTLFAANVMAGTLVRTAGRGPETDTQLLQAQAKALETLNRGALAEMRMLMFELRPDAFEGTTLAELLKHQIEAIECRGDIEVLQSLSSADHLDAPTRIQLYRIAQEALTNMSRHAQARHVTLEWRALPEGGGRLRIADDGQGFDPDAEFPGHFGLTNIRSRAAEIGAQLSLNTAPGQGCELIVELP